MSKMLIELFAKAPKNYGNAPSACPFSQRWFMIFYLLVEKKLADLRVINISKSAPPEEYTKYFVGAQLPAVALYEENNQKEPSLYSGNDELKMMTRKLFGSHVNVDTHIQWVSSDLLRNLNTFLRNGSLKALVKDLYELERFIGNRSTKFLDGDDLSYADCAIATKIHQVRIAGEFYQDFSIPYNFSNLWSYLGRIYSTQAFKQSCPNDRDILLHNLKKVNIQDPDKKLEAERIIFGISDHRRSLTIPADTLECYEAARKNGIKLKLKSKMTADEFNSFELPTLLREALAVANDTNTIHSIKIT